MASRSEDMSDHPAGFERGQRLYCAHCSSEIEVINPTAAEPPAQEFRCCGEPMRPSTGASVNMNVVTGME